MNGNYRNQSGGAGVWEYQRNMVQIEMMLKYIRMNKSLLESSTHFTEWWSWSGDSLSVFYGAFLTISTLHTHTHEWLRPIRERARAHRTHSFPFSSRFLINAGGLHIGNWFLIFAVLPPYLSHRFIQSQAVRLYSNGGNQVEHCFCFLHFENQPSLSLCFEAIWVLKWTESRVK